MANSQANQDAMKRLFQGNPQNPLYGDTPAPDPSQPMPPTNAQPPASTAPQSAPQAAPAIQPGQIAAALNPPQSKQDYLGSNPVAMPARPRGDFDKIPDGQPGSDTWGNRHNVLRHALASLFAGAAEFGGDLNHHPGAAAPFINRWQGQTDQQREFDQNQPVMRQKAENEQYNTALGQQQTKTGIEKEQAEIPNIRANVPMLQRQQALLDKVRTLKESGKYASDTDLFNAVLPEASTIPGMTRQQIVDVINGSKTLGSKYTITRDPQTQSPIELVDRQGNHFSQSNLPKDPEAQQMWQDAQSAAGNKLSAEEGKEKRVADYGAQSQARAFAQQDTEKGKQAASQSLQELNDAKNQQKLIEDLARDPNNDVKQAALMFQMAGVERPAGMKRLPPQAIEELTRMGGLSERLSRQLMNWKQGDVLPRESIPELVEAAKTINSSKVRTANDNLESTTKIHGYKVPGSDARGRLDKPGDYQEAKEGGQGGGALSVDEARQYLQKAGGDKDKARAAAKADGRSF